MCALVPTVLYNVCCVSAHAVVWWWCYCPSYPGTRVSYIVSAVYQGPLLPGAGAVALAALVLEYLIVSDVYQGPLLDGGGAVALAALILEYVSYSIGCVSGPSVGWG